jgi:hypothetical protein
VIQALGVSPEEGLCIAPPLNITTFRPFFLHVDLPYAAVRLEQLEVRATIYNYMTRSISVSFIKAKSSSVDEFLKADNHSSLHISSLQI